MDKEMEKRKSKNKGFSLIELIIAIAILVILTGLLAPQFMKYIEKSRLAKDLQSLDGVYMAVQGAITDEEGYLALADSTGDYQKSKITEDGMKLEDILGRSDDFAEEVKNILGLDDTEKLTFDSKAAKDQTVYVKVDSKMQVGVWCGDKDNCAFDDGLGVELRIGTIAPHKKSSGETP